MWKHFGFEVSFFPWKIARFIWVEFWAKYVPWAYERENRNDTSSQQKLMALVINASRFGIEFRFDIEYSST